MPIMNNIWLLVELNSNAMTTQITHNAITILLCVLLNCMTNITNKRIGFCGFSTYFKAFFSYSNQAFLLWSCLTAYNKHTTCIGKITIYNRCHINIDDIALLKNILLLWNTMANNLIYTSTNALRITFIIQTSRNGVMIFAILHTNIIYFLRIHSYMNGLCNGI